MAALKPTVKEKKGGGGVIRWRRLYSFSKGLYPRRITLSPNMCRVEVKYPYRVD